MRWTGGGGVGAGWVYPAAGGSGGGEGCKNCVEEAKSAA